MRGVPKPKPPCVVTGCYEPARWRALGWGDKVGGYREWEALRCDRHRPTVGVDTGGCSGVVHIESLADHEAGATVTAAEREGSP